MWGDQAWVLASARIRPPAPVPPFDGDARFSLVTVNFSTTRYLALMLLTLAEQDALHRVRRIVVVDNDSRDGGLPLLRNLAARHPAIHLVENRLVTTHARGLRLGAAAVDALDRAAERPTNVLLVCDTDVVFRSRRTLGELAERFAREPAPAFVGELRRGLYPYPEAQASFFAVRRDCYARRDVRPFVHHGAPAYWMQRSLWRAGLGVDDFPSNHGGYVLHRGRSGVAAARARPGASNATARFRDPHFMGVPEGPHVWATIEARHAALLDGPTDVLAAALLERLADVGRG